MKTAPAFRSTACLRNRTAMTAAIGLALLSLQPQVALARFVSNGSTHTVVPGDVVEDWDVTGRSTLIVESGAETARIRAESQSQIVLNGATVTTDSGTSSNTALQLFNSSATIVGSRITSTVSDGFSASINVADPVRSSATITGSHIEGLSRGAVIVGSDVTFIGTTIIGHDTVPRNGGGGLQLNAGSAEVLGDSLIQGDVTGVRMRVVTLGGQASASASLVVDSSRIESGAGSAIVVESEVGDAGQADIILRNGTTVAAGNGILLDVVNNRGPGAIANLLVESSTVAGDIRVASDAFAHVTLQDGGRINGRFDNVTSATIGDGGHWQLTGDSDVGALSLGTGGVVALGDGTAFNTLTVTGDYTGSGGALLFNTVLGDDTAASDKLIVNGSTSGQTRVAVNNVGGIGAQTVNGIQLIQVDGASNGQFDLAGRAVGGQYEYFLFKGGKADPNDGDWYLRSELPVAPPEPDPCLADPNAPGCVITLPEQCLIDPSLPQCLPPVPVLRPEPGAYLANQSAAVQMFGTRFHDRNGGIARGLSERGAWARVSRNQADYGVIGDQLSVNGDTDVLQVGTDVFTWGAERGQLGVMLGSGRANNTITSRLTGYSAKGKVEGQAIGIYGSWLQDPAQTTGLYVDAWAQHARFKNSVQGDGLSKERYDSTANSASVEAGYGIQVAASSGPRPHAVRRRR
ncbi:autotransporter outer membrane beta-barrel domain-containing protein [Stenotrophomonas sp. JAG2]|uniref:autotransporter family protein n=1 Tax=Stenotrophomonas sp. JAG2 TaxID=3229243 RepID=UPI0034E264C3